MTQSEDVFMATDSVIEMRLYLIAESIKHLQDSGSDLNMKWSNEPFSHWEVSLIDDDGRYHWAMESELLDALIAVRRKVNGTT